MAGGLQALSRDSDEMAFRPLAVAEVVVQFKTATLIYPHLPFRHFLFRANHTF